MGLWQKINKGFEKVTGDYHQYLAELEDCSDNRLKEIYLHNSNTLKRMAAGKLLRDRGYDCQDDY